MEAEQTPNLLRAASRRIPRTSSAGARAPGGRLRCEFAHGRGSLRLRRFAAAKAIRCGEGDSLRRRRFATSPNPFRVRRACQNTEVAPPGNGFRIRPCSPRRGAFLSAAPLCPRLTGNAWHDRGGVRIAALPADCLQVRAARLLRSVIPAELAEDQPDYRIGPRACRDGSPSIEQAHPVPSEMDVQTGSRPGWPSASVGRGLGRFCPLRPCGARPAV